MLKALINQTLTFMRWLCMPVIQPRGRDIGHRNPAQQNPAQQNPEQQNPEQQNRNGGATSWQRHIL
jgi:hypothetical protein